MRGFLFRLRRINGSASASSRLLRSSGTTLPKDRFCFSTDSEGSSRVKIFDRDLKRKHRDRAAWLMRPQDSLTDTVAENLLDRLEDCKKTFPTALCLGGSLAAVRRLLRGRGAIEKLIMMDTSYDMIKLCKESEPKMGNENIETSFVVADEEFLPIQESSLDLVISCLGLHWTNDLPGAMIQCKLGLKPDGLFLAAILGGETLKLFMPTCLCEIDVILRSNMPDKFLYTVFCMYRELRIACTIAQMEREGGISPRVSPLAQVRDAGNLLTRAGFSLPGVDVDEYTVRYKSAFELIEHLRAMGETNALLQRSAILKRERIRILI
ncbi:putative methyltransferase At1g22800, mitochondrial isoform X3 [Punica granatum]|uniref:Methyltransferase At1g22800, mitochondrial isoform X3 n=1 Tax=Punica granatum TaxID=22663 RepID=A0A6P8BYF9_PUNGR|nr:putative methyltransferase At1g22800, mitochondrial isoform X3 [Punica granatum]